MKGLGQMFFSLRMTGDQDLGGPGICKRDLSGRKVFVISRPTIT